MNRGEVWWASLPDRRGSEPGFRRPVVIVQADDFNRSRIGTVMVIPLTSNVALAAAPGNVLLAARDSGLPKRSVANVAQVLTIDRTFLDSRVRALRRTHLDAITAGLRLSLGL